MSGPTITPIREPQTIARLSQTFSTSLSASEIAEPIISVDDNQTDAFAAEVLRSRGESVLGVRHSGRMIGYVTAMDLLGGTIDERMREFRREEVLDSSLGLDVVLGKLATADYIFVEWLGEVAGVITRRDLQKPPVRMWLFGAITILDANMTWAIEKLYPGDTWQGSISSGRMEKALALRAERQRQGSDCRLVDCLQIADKSRILTSDEDNIEALGLLSRREAERLMREVEGLRNHLAHAQELEGSHLETAAKLANVIHPILRAEGVQRILTAREVPTMS